MENEGVTYINGFLRALSCGCHDCDYVPFYDAESFEFSENSFTKSLEHHFYAKEPVRLRRQSKPSVSNFQLVKDEWKAVLSKLLIKWIDSKLSMNQVFADLYKDDLFELIEDVVGKEPLCFIANIEHDTMELCNDTFGFAGEGKAFYLQFSFSD